MLRDGEKDTIILGNCLEVMQDFPDGCVDLVVTSPPRYFSSKTGSRYESFDEYIAAMRDVFYECIRIVKNHRYIIINVSDVFTEEKVLRRKPVVASFILFMSKMGCEYEDNIVWCRDEGVSSRLISSTPYPYYFKPVYRRESILVFRKNIPNDEKIPCPVCGKMMVQRNGTSRDGVQSWECVNPDCRKSEHNRGKRFTERSVLMESAVTEENRIPEGIMNAFRTDVVDVKNIYFELSIPEFAILCYSKKGDLVFDPFFGKGDTGYAAIKSHRHYLGTEEDESVYRKAKNRMAVFGYSTPLF